FNTDVTKDRIVLQQQHFTAVTVLKHSETFAIAALVLQMHYSIGASVENPNLPPAIGGDI
ncbi:MAG: hypothetical protein WCA20_31080, partial [Candidatus Sulfotelmatobacter sp.]